MRARAVVRALFLFSAFCTLPSALFAAVPTSQRDALLSLYTSTNGPQWIDRTGWQGAAGTECEWYGVRCDNDGNNIDALELGENNLTGTLPGSIRNLASLRSLYLPFNSIGGPIPSELSELSNLQALYLGANQFTGTIPPSLGALAKLENLDLGGNRLEGTIPPALGNLAALVDLRLAYNQLTGPIPSELSRLINLTGLDLAGNRLSGALPDGLGSLSKLQSLFLADNQLTGTIPASLGNLQSLVYLQLAYNKLSGPLPPQLGGLKSIEEIRLNRNAFTGTIPRELGDLATLQVLDLSETSLTGTIPADLYRLRSLVELYLGDNKLEGPISPAIAGLTSLEVLYLHDNDLSGAIPVELTTIAPLRVLLLPRNELTGTIPREMSRLTNLEMIQLQENHLRGSIPRELGSLSKLTRLSIEQNEIEGTIPTELGQLTNLEILSMGFNKLTGPIPESFRSLRKLIEWSMEYNDLDGQLPSWLGELTELAAFFAGHNDLSGPIPASVADLRNLRYFDVADNVLTGTLPDFSRLGQMVHFVVGGNRLSGPIPASIGVLKEATYLDLAANTFTGSLPREIGQLAKVEYFTVWNNRLEGPIPAEVGGMKAAYAISFAENRLTGAIPREIGNLTALQYLDVSFNALRGPVPREITNMAALLDGSQSFAFNGLFTTDSAVDAFLTRKQVDWKETQTIKPTNVRVTAASDRGITLEWTPIVFSWGPGGYQVAASKTAGGPPSSIATTSAKDITSIVVRNLDPQTAYFLTVTAVTHPFSVQENLIVSDATDAVSATTTARVIAPPDVAVTESTTGLVQIGGVASNEDSFTLTNFGDGTADLSIAKDGDFFTLEADAITIAGGASRTIKVRSVTKPIGTYYGGAYVIGEGATDGLYIPVVLLSVAKPAGTVIAEAIDDRIELTGLAGSDAVGFARFRNSGTAPLSGIVIADQPWLVPSPDPITIEPNQTANVNFRILRSRRPPQTEGALTATLSLVYVDGSVVGALQTTTPSSGINVSKVTIVDVTKPPVTPSPFGVAPFGEVALFVPGVVSGLRGFGSDLSILNGSSSRSVTDLRLYFTLLGGSSSVATLQPLPSNQTVTLTNVVANVYNAAQGTGTVQVRSAAGENLAVLARMTGLRNDGTFSGETPVFRGDSSVRAGEKIYLAGLRATSDLLVQEVSGTTTAIRIELLDANGAAVSAPQDTTVGALGLLEIRNVAANAVTAVITNNSGGRIVAYARVIDPATGDMWSIVDWSRQNRYALTEPIRVPLAHRLTASGGRGKRRAVHGDAVSGGTTDLTLFNPGTAEADVSVDVISANGRTAHSELTIGALRTILLPNVVTTTDAATAHVVVTPMGRSSRVVVTARSTHTAVPVVGSLEGLRVGQARSFAGLDDSTSATIAAASAATFTTSYGFVETVGEPVRVRARLFFGSQERSLVSANVFRDFELAANAQIVVPELVRSLAGDTRDSAYGDLHNLRLQIEVIEGKGAVVPFVVVTDNGSGDTLMRIQ